MEHVRWTARPELHEPVVIAAFEGWNDAGDAATTAARYLVDRWDADLVADVDPEEFYDFTSTRPQVHLDDDGQRQIEWPATEVFAGSIPGVGTDVLIIVGTEPQLRWRTYCAELAEIARSNGARLCVTLGALLAEVPHTRPTPIVGTAYDPDVVAGRPAAAVELRGTHRDRRRAPRHVAHGRPAHRVAVGHRAVLRARRAVTQGRAGAGRARRRDARRRSS